MSKHKLYRVAYTEYAKGYFEVSAMDDAHLERILDNLDELGDNKVERDYSFDLGQIEEIGYEYE